MTTRRLQSAFLLGAAGMCSAPEVLRAQAQAGPEVRSVVFQGANSLDQSIIRRSIRTTASRCRSPFFFLLCQLGVDRARTRSLLDSAEVRRDEERIATLYEAWGFPDARARSEITAAGRSAVNVIFHVTEGRPLTIRSIQVRGTEPVPGFRVPAQLPLRTGEPYALPRLESTEQLLYAELAERGYPHARIEISGNVDERAYTADITLQVEPAGRAVFGSTRIRSEAPIEESAVRRRLAYRTGEAFSVAALQQTERNLYALPIVERAVAEARAGEPNDSVLQVDVTVSARRAHGVTGEALISSTDCAELRGFWQHRYFLDGPRVFSLGVYAANLLAEQAGGDFPCTSTGTGVYAQPNYGAHLDLRQFIGRSSTLTARAFALRESSPDVYVQRGFGGELAWSRNFTPRLSALLRAAPERNRLEAAELYFCGQYGVCTADGITSLSDWSWLSPLEAVVSWTSSPEVGQLRRPELGPGREWPTEVVPVQRWSVRAAVAAAAPITGSQHEYQRALLELTSTRALGSSLEIAARVRAGALAAEEVVPPQVMFFSGGANTVRGVGQNLLGPMVLATRNRPPNCEPCTPQTLLDPDLVTLRPTGGDRLLEANLEARVWLGSSAQLALFVDFGRLERSAFNGIERAHQTLITPGIGLRVISDLGPLRLDIGYDASGTRRYPLFLQENGTLLSLGDVLYNPFEFDRPSFFKETQRRLQLQLSIGQAF